MVLTKITGQEARFSRPCRLIEFSMPRIRVALLKAILWLATCSIILVLFLALLVLKYLKTKALCWVPRRIQIISHNSQEMWAIQTTNLKSIRRLIKILEMPGASLVLLSKDRMQALSQVLRTSERFIMAAILKITNERLIMGLRHSTFKKLTLTKPI